jgi:hypothetical protein
MPPIISAPASTQGAVQILVKSDIFLDTEGFRDHELTEIRQIVTDNRELFLERWHEYFGGAS